MHQVFFSMCTCVCVDRVSGTIQGFKIEKKKRRSDKSKSKMDESADTMMEDTEADSVYTPDVVKSYKTAKGRTLRIVIGFICGIGSSLTGTSGPVVLLPMLIAFDWDVLDALGVFVYVCMYVAYDYIYSCLYKYMFV